MAFPQPNFPSGSDPSPFCRKCLEVPTKGLSLKRCSKCKTCYCSRECQKADWRKHKLICKAPPLEDTNKNSGTPDAAKATPEDHPGPATYQNNPNDKLYRRYEQTGKRKDPEETGTIEDLNQAVEVSDYSTLCFACKKAMKLRLEPDGEEGFSKEEHHQSLEGLQNAISAGCFICQTYWEALDDETRANDRLWVVFLNGTRISIFQQQSLDRIFISISSDPHQPPASVKFTLYRVRGSDNEPTFSFRQIESNTSSTLSLDTAFQWYLSCREGHSGCRCLRSETPWLPTRLLDIGVEGDPKWKLVMSSGLESSKTEYMTLSYRWDTNPKILLKSSTMDKFCHGQPISALPRTFQDFIVVARRFTVRYIWIDSLCIIQDSYDDWQRESVKMQLVYANACCSIAASASADSEEGLFRSRRPKFIRPGLVKKSSLCTFDYEDYYVYDDSYVQRQLFSGPIHKRGWVFQERLLPARVLYFAKHQIFWECFQEHKCEAFPVQIPGQKISLKTRLQFLLDDNNGNRGSMSDAASLLWALLVAEYTKCDLTKHSDRLVAFSGIAGLFQTVTGDQYLAGLWRSKLVEQLGWSVNQYLPTIDMQRPAPSWSWASITRPVDAGTFINERSVKHHVSIVEAQVKTVQADALGEVLHGHITLNGSLIHAKYHTHRASNEYFLGMLCIGSKRIRGQLRLDVASKCSLDDKEIPGLLLLSYTPQNSGSGYSLVVFLLLLELQVDSNHNTYIRIGSFQSNGMEREIAEEFGFVLQDNELREYMPNVQQTLITLV